MPPTTTTSLLALGLVLGACGPTTTAPPTAVATPRTPSAFAAPGAPAATTVGDVPSSAAAAVILGAGRRWQDTSLAVAAALPIAATHLGAAARVHLHIEGVDAPGPGAVVVVVLAIELVAGAPRVQRLAVPVVLTAEGWQPGTPWGLPVPPVGPALGDDLALPRLPIDDAPSRALAHRALAAAGWREVELLSLDAATEAWPSVATFTAVDADGQRSRQTVWLRRHLDRLVVAGLPAPHPDQRATADQESQP